MKGMKKRAFAVFTAAFMTVSMAAVTQLPGQAYADNGDPGMVTGTSVLEKNAGADGLQKVRYGKDGSSSVSQNWYVIGHNGTGNSYAAKENVITLLYKGVGENTVFYRRSDDWTANYYVYSRLKQLADSIYDGGSSEWVFTDKERSVIVPRTLEGGGESYDDDNPDNGYDKNKVKGETIENAYFWIPSVAEAEEMPAAVRHEKDAMWWLRTPGYWKNNVAYVMSDGRISLYGSISSVERGIRPAFDIDMNSVMLTSAATGGKQTGTGEDPLTKVEANTNDEWKLTLKDDSHTAFTAKYDLYRHRENKLDISYSGAKAGDNEYVSAVISDKSGNVKYYGRFVNVTTQEQSSGSITLDLEGKYSEGDEVFIFNEQCNGDQNTDYSSGLVKIDVRSFRNIKVTVDYNCSVNLPADKAVEGETVSFEVVPNSGCKIETVFVYPDDNTTNTLPLTRDESDPDRYLYSFTMIDKDVKLFSMCVLEESAGDPEDPAEGSEQPGGTDTRPAETDTQPAETDTQPSGDTAAKQDNNTSTVQPAASASNTSVVSPAAYASTAGSTKAPVTGDRSNTPVWTAVSATAAAGVVVTMIAARKKRED